MSLALLVPEDLARADGMTGVIVFAVVYAIVSIMAKVKQAAQKQQQDHQQQQQQARQQKRLDQQRQPRRQQPRVQHSRSQPAGDTQAEALKLQDLLRVLTETAGVPTPVPLPSAEEVEERESLEAEEEIRNLETEERRPSRGVVDFDDEAEMIVQRRIREAQERDRALSKVDHQAFDSRIRAVADATRVARPKLDSLRRAIVWREILGPPVALRDDREL